jgi:hypothetical protein
VLVVDLAVFWVDVDGERIDVVRADLEYPGCMVVEPDCGVKVMHSLSLLQ